MPTGYVKIEAMRGRRKTEKQVFGLWAKTRRTGSQVFRNLNLHMVNSSAFSWVLRVPPARSARPVHSLQLQLSPRVVGTQELKHWDSCPSMFSASFQTARIRKQL